MTASELNAITQLGKRFDDFREDNKEGHEDIKAFIKDVEARLTEKLTEKDSDIKSIVNHCKEREIEVDAALARGVVASDAHIAAAKLEAVAEATKPSVYTLATKGAFEGVLRFAVKATVIVALAGSCVALLKGVGLL